jgi:NAD(P)-dependent dehydrogenase (short-subunit alcohol dehydrogenase family)
MEQLFLNKVAIVTGGSAGIGRAASLIFAREGAKVVVGDIDIDGGKETVRMIEEAGGAAAFVKTDVSKTSDAEAMVNKAVEAYGRLDCAFNNAGISLQQPIIKMTEEEWDHIIDTNLKSIFLCMKYEITQMLKQGGGGAIVNTSSIAGVVGTANLSAYVASRHGIVGLTKSVALEYVKQGIRVNAVGPHFSRNKVIDYDIIHRPEWIAQELKKTPMGRYSNPSEIAEAAVWLCSDKASFIVGQLLLADGGYTIH